MAPTIFIDYKQAERKERKIKVSIVKTLTKHEYQLQYSLLYRKVLLTPGGVLDISLSREVRRGPSYPDPV